MSVILNNASYGFALCRKYDLGGIYGCNWHRHFRAADYNSLRRIFKWKLMRDWMKSIDHLVVFAKHIRRHSIPNEQCCPAALILCIVEGKKAIRRSRFCSTFQKQNARHNKSEPYLTIGTHFERDSDKHCVCVCGFGVCYTSQIESYWLHRAQSAHVPIYLCTEY